MPAPEPASRVGAAVGAALAASAVWLALVMPNHPGAATAGALAVFPLELPAVLLALALARGRAATALAAGVAAWLALMVAVKLADLAALSAFGRMASPVFDLPLLGAGARLALGALGWPLALAAGLALAAALAAPGIGLWRATRRLARPEVPTRWRVAAAAALAAAVALVAADVGRRPFDPPGAAFTARLTLEHAGDLARARADLAAFRAAAAADAAAARSPQATLAALAGRDVAVIFVESYGRIAFEAPEVAAVARPRLAGLEATLAAHGLAARSGFVASPIVGGRSWLAHATLLVGVGVADQPSYRALTASPRRALTHLARAAGWRTLGAMPGVTLDWPEGAWFGYDRILAAADLGRAPGGAGWTPLPDQLTLAALGRALDAGPPALAVAALVSSHAPWTPVPPLLPWDALTDAPGSGPPAAGLWRDPARLRRQYALSLDYVLGAVGGFAARRGAPAPLIVVLGDHQPAPAVTGPGAGADVPVHVIGPPELVDRLAAWGWPRGLFPDPATPTFPMADFRDRFLDAFAETPAFTADAGALVSPR